jgi:hypothetical protein
LTYRPTTGGEKQQRRLSYPRCSDVLRKRET